MATMRIVRSRAWVVVRDVERDRRGRENMVLREGRGGWGSWGGVGEGEIDRCERYRLPL